MNAGTPCYIETAVVPQAMRAELRITGQMGDVMKESSAIAYTFAKSFLGGLVLDTRGFESASLHMHIPEGATPKDGPSAGIAMVTSLLSVAMDKPVHRDLAMTGEVTLTGKVLTIGGLREKTVAAKRAGIKTMVIPVGNKEDWKKLPEYIRRGININFADFYKDVFAVAFPSIATAIESQKSTTKKPLRGSVRLSEIRKRLSRPSRIRIRTPSKRKSIDIPTTDPTSVPTTPTPTKTPPIDHPTKTPPVTPTKTPKKFPTKTPPAKTPPTKIPPSKIPPSKTPPPKQLEPGSKPPTKLPRKSPIVSKIKK